jgi:hypothetical protein
MAVAAKMKVLKILALVLALFLAGAVAIAVTWPVAVLYLYVAFSAPNPSSISWDAKNAWLKCEGAVAGKVDWPAAPPAACAAMHLCAKQAALGVNQRETLKAAARRLPGCGEP